MIFYFYLFGFKSTLFKSYDFFTHWSRKTSGSIWVDLTTCIDFSHEKNPKSLTELNPTEVSGNSRTLSTQLRTWLINSPMSLRKNHWKLHVHDCSLVTLCIVSSTASLEIMVRCRTSGLLYESILLRNLQNINVISSHLISLWWLIAAILVIRIVVVEGGPKRNNKRTRIHNTMLFWFLLCFVLFLLVSYSDR